MKEHLSKGIYFFNKVNFDHIFARASRTKSAWATNFETRVRGQYVDRAMPGHEQTPISGAYGVRSIQPGSFSGDRARIVNAKISWPRLIPSKSEKFGAKRRQRWGLEPFIFADWAEAIKLDESDLVRGKARFTGAGLGLSFQAGRYLQGKMTYGKPLQYRLDNETVPKDGLWLFEVRLF